MVSKPPSLNEIRTRLDAFVHEHANDHQEHAEAQTWWNDLLDCYGIRRARVATFERRATRASTGGRGRIDVFWPRVFIWEHKSAGRIDTADDQAFDYLYGGDVSPAEFPRYIIVSDFRHIRINDLESDDPPVTIPVTDLPANAELLGFLAGYTHRTYTTAQEAAASVEASKLMANLYTKLSGDADTEPDDEDTHQVSMLLTRLLFLMFGDDAGLWDRNLFGDFVGNRTSSDGSDLGAQLLALFAILNTPEHRRPARADEALLAFPYVNGALFEGQAQMPYFDAGMREALLEACRFDWTAISPAVFGSLFQAIKSRQARREGAEHYTTEENILKTIGPLFLDDLHTRLKAAWNQPKRLRALHDDIGQMRYLDPACGCGNFLVVAYREMRRLELELLVRLKELDGSADELTLDGTWDLKVSLDQFHGIEINWWPAKIAETAMFLVDHQMNREMALALGQAPDRLPIKITAHIHHTNALTADWAELLPPTTSTYVFGNPPFLGHISRTVQQTEELQAAWAGADIGRLDYVTAWYASALHYFRRRPSGRWAFVSTNSIAQGDQVPRLFAPIFDSGWRIRFAHRTFKWTSEATGRAAVHCIVVGFDRLETPRPRLFDYASVSADPHEVKADSINAYLVDGPNVLVGPRREPLSSMLTPITFGNMPRDGGGLVIEPDAFMMVMEDRVAAKYVRPFVGSEELLHGKDRWCLWLPELDPADLERSPFLRQRIALVRTKRAGSKAASTRGMAATPHLFGQRAAIYADSYLCIPRVVSETRRYFTAARLTPDVIPSDRTYSASDADGFLFAIVSSSMFITWQRTVGVTLKSDLSFSNTIVWNNLPLPVVDDNMRAKIIKAGECVLDARALHPERSLAEHYNPLAMDPNLVNAHDHLDAVVDRAFGAKRTCRSERERQEILFACYQELTASQPTQGESRPAP